MKIEIVIVKSRLTNHWGYCPAEARTILRPELDDEETGFLTAQQALNDAKQNPTIPKDAKFTIIHPDLCSPPPINPKP